MSIDLEVNPKTACVFDLAAVYNNDTPSIRGKNSGVAAALDKLEANLGNIRHLIGHNILGHDLPHLDAVRPRLAQLAREPIDTLWLNPLAFPRNPYHHLVKHYHDGREASAVSLYDLCFMAGEVWREQVERAVEGNSAEAT